MYDRGERATSIMFKRVAGGWVYRAPNPWIFGNAPHYVVNDAQKAQIEAIIVPRRPLLAGLLIASAIVAWVFGLMGIVWLLTGHDDPTSGDLIAVAALTAISLLTAIPLVNWIQRRRLKPVLAGLPLSQQQITFADMRENARAGHSFRQSRNAFMASAFASFAAVFAVCSHYIAKPVLDAHLVVWIFNAVLFGFLAVVWYRRALRKATETSIEAELPDADRFVRLTRIAVLIAAVGLAVLVFGLQVLHQHWVPTKPDYAALRVRYELAAYAGDSKAMNGLGLLYQQGLGSAQDFTKAREWYEKAAAAGDSAAMGNLGSLYQNGRGVSQDYAKARAWFEKSAATGNSSAMNSLGWLYQNGFGVNQDYAQAIDWYQKASVGGSAAGTSNLAWLYQNGWGAPRDFPKALLLHERAAREGIAFSMDALGAMYTNGWGVSMDSAKAREWYEKAASARNLVGMQHLAVMLDAGKGGPTDPIRAAHLILESARLGHTWSMTVLQGSLEFLTPPTRTELKRELARLSYYSGTIDDSWDDSARAAATAYLDAHIGASR